MRAGMFLTCDVQFVKRVMCLSMQKNEGSEVMEKTFQAAELTHDVSCNDQSSNDESINDKLSNDKSCNFGSYFGSHFGSHSMINHVLVLQLGMFSHNFITFILLHAKAHDPDGKMCDRTSQV